MATFIMLTRLSHEGLKSPDGLESLEHEVMAHIRSQCPSVKWIHNYAVFGPYDYLDIFEAPDQDSATRVSTLIRTIGHAQAEIWPATEWHAFKDLLHTLPRAGAEPPAATAS